jgi:glucose-6-phosphate isomerase
MDESQAGYTQDIRAQMETIEKNISAFFQQVTEETGEIILDVLYPVFDQSQIYCPVKNGTLRDSGYLELKKSASGATVEMGYAKGGQPNYAVYVHEFTGFHHAAPTRAKFLQAALEEAMPSIEADLCAAFGEMVQ